MDHPPPAQDLPALVRGLPALVNRAGLPLTEETHAMALGVAVLATTALDQVALLRDESDARLASAHLIAAVPLVRPALALGVRVEDASALRAVIVREVLARRLESDRERSR